LCSGQTMAVVQQFPVTVRLASWNPFSRKGKKASSLDIYESPENLEMEEYAQEIKALEAEVREEYIESRRNKSRLTASHRNILQGRHPNVGVIYEYGDVHRSRKFKRQIFGRYGTKSGIDPGTLWPTEKDISLAKEWESLYQPEPLLQQMENVKLKEAAVIQKRKEREDKIDANLEKLDSQLAQWKNRLEAKNKLSDANNARRAKVLAELKAEFGYDVNPMDESMAIRIAERETVLRKEEREMKKQLRKEKLAAEKEQKEES